MNEDYNVDDYIDNYTLTLEELEEYDINASLNNIISIIKDYRKARNKYINGYHLRVTTNYKPILEERNFVSSDKIGDAVCNMIDSEKEYNRFNQILKKILELMTKEERIYVTECLLSSKSDSYVKEKFNITRRNFEHCKSSAIVKFAIAFSIEEYKN